MAEPSVKRGPLRRGVRLAWRWAVRVAPVLVLAYALAGYATSRLSVGPPVVAGPLVQGEVPVAFAAFVGVDGDAEASPDAPGATDWAAGSSDEVEMRGALSVHTGRSHDAEGTRDEVVRAASAAGLDFVVLGDHPSEWSDAGPAAGAPERRGEVLVLSGLELVVNDHGRLLVVGLDSLPRRWESGLPALEDRIAASGAFASVVHPRSPRARERWSGLAPTGVHAWESFDVSEMARLRLAEPWAAYHVVALLAGLAVGGGEGALIRLAREGFASPALLAYDSARAERPLTLTGGLNSHPKARLASWLFPPYQPFFRAVVNHLILPAPASSGAGEAQAEVLDALRTGSLYVSLGASEEAAGFRFAAATPGSGPIGMGGRTPWLPGARLRVQLPPGASGGLLVRVVRDGRTMSWVSARPGGAFEWPAPRPGVYRVEVHEAGLRIGRLRWDRRAWIVSNPIELTLAAPNPELDAGGVG